MSKLSSVASALLGALVLSTGCGRIVKLTPPGKVYTPPDATTIKMQLPAGAVCLPRTNGFDTAAVSNSPLSDTTYSTCKVWTDARPAGVCYDADQAWAGLPDHVAYLTFDDGPIDWTPAILDTLKKEHIHATFFVNSRGTKGPVGLDGSFIDEKGKTVVYRDILKREVDEGHVIGNHTRDHSDLGTLTREQVDEQYAENERLINDALVRAGGQARPLSLIRAPFGSPWFAENLDDAAMHEALVGSTSMKYGYNVLWNVTSTDAYEWAQGEGPTLKTVSDPKGVTRDPSLTYQMKKDRIRSSIFDHPLVARGAGIVILMHDTHNSTRDLLPEIISGLRERGYSFDDLENQVLAQFGRPSVELTPGPSLTAACAADESERSCEKVAGSDVEVCGRFWLAFQELGVDKLGVPVSPPEGAELTVQRFENGTVELHPEWPAPCDAIFVPND